MAHITTNEIFNLNVESRLGVFVAFSNTLVDAGKWDDVRELREMMNVRGISKDTACIWVGNDVVYNVPSF